MKKTKILFAIWAIIVVIIIALLTALGFILDNRYEKYRTLEEKLETSAREYAMDNVLLNEEDGEYIVTSEELIEAGYLDNLEVDDNVCTGYVVVFINMRLILLVASIQQKIMMKKNKDWLIPIFIQF